MQRPEPSQFARLWGLDSACVFLNHGSFGATPIAVREEQQRWQNRFVYILYQNLPDLHIRQTLQSKAWSWQNGRSVMRLVFQ